MPFDFLINHVGGAKGTFDVRASGITAKGGQRRQPCLGSLHLSGENVPGKGLLTLGGAGMVVLTWTIAEWAFGIGVLTIVFALVTWGRLRDAWLWLLGGILLIALGAALLWFTWGGLLAPGIALGLFGIVYGLVSLAIAGRTHRHPAAAPPAHR